MSTISDTSFGLQRYPNPCNSFLCNTDTLQYGHFYLLQFSWFCCPSSDLAKVSLESLSKDVFERRTSTGKDVLSAFFGSGFAQIFGKIVPIRVKTLPGTLTTQIWWRQEGTAKGKRHHFRLTCIAQRHLCLSSLFYI